MYHLDSNILAQFCDLKWFSREASSAVNDYKETASFSLGRKSVGSVLMHRYKCDWIWENRSKSHILYFEKYQFEILKPL